MVCVVVVCGGACGMHANLCGVCVLDVVVHVDAW